MKQATKLLRIASVLWIVWGMSNLITGSVLLANLLFGASSQAVQSLLNNVTPASLPAEYSQEFIGLLQQHVFTMLWFGLVVFVAGLYVWSGRTLAVYLTCIVGGFATLGQLFFLDIPGYVRFFPNILLTIIALLATVLTISGYAGSRSTN